MISFIFNEIELYCCLWFRKILCLFIWFHSLIIYPIHLFFGVCPEVFSLSPLSVYLFNSLLIIMLLQPDFHWYFQLNKFWQGNMFQEKIITNKYNGCRCWGLSSRSLHIWRWDSIIKEKHWWSPSPRHVYWYT